jgi:ribonuclease BN (tRNA processing enzyme)
MPVTVLPRPTSTVTQQKTVFLFISHLHIDHIAGLHTLVKLALKKGLRICIQAGTGADLQAFVREPFMVPFSDLPYPAEIIELAEGRHTLPFSVDCRLWYILYPVSGTGRRSTER